MRGDFVVGNDILKCWMVASRACGLIVPSRRQIYTIVSDHLVLNVEVKDSTDLEASFLQAERNQVQEIDKLAEHKTLG